MDNVASRSWTPITSKSLAVWPGGHGQCRPRESCWIKNGIALFNDATEQAVMQVSAMVLRSLTKWSMGREEASGERGRKSREEVDAVSACTIALCACSPEIFFVQPTHKAKWQSHLLLPSIGRRSEYSFLLFFSILFSLLSSALLHSRTAPHKSFTSLLDPHPLATQPPKSKNPWKRL